MSVIVIAITLLHNLHLIESILEIGKRQQVSEEVF